MNPYQPPEQPGVKVEHGVREPISGEPQPLKELGLAVLLAACLFVVMLIGGFLIAIVFAIYMDR